MQEFPEFYAYKTRGTTRTPNGFAKSSTPRTFKGQHKTKADSQQDKAVSVLLKIVHWLCVEGLPMSKFKSLLELLHDLNVPDISILKNGQTKLRFVFYVR